MNEKKIVAITAGLSTPSSTRLLTDTISKAISQELTVNRTTSTVQTIELRDYAVEIANNMTSGFPSQKLASVIKAVEEADVLIAVTPVFTASMSGLFKSFFDIINNKVLTNKIVVIGATGGTSRHSQVLDFAMRPMFAYLHADVIPTGIFAAPEDWGDGAGMIENRSKLIAEEVARRLHHTPAKKYVEVMTSLPFEQLLANIQK